MVLEVYLDPCTVNSRKVLAGLDLMGAEYHFNFINYFEGGQKDPEFVKNINPMATVPAAVDGDLHLTESNAILQYGADTLSKETSAYPKDLKTRAKINQWLLWEASVWFPSCYVYLVENVVKPLLGQEPSQDVLSEQAPKWNKLAAVLDTPLSKTKFIVGDEPTIADIAVASCIHLHSAMKVPLEQHPSVKRWIADVEKLEAWKKTQGAVEKALLPNKKAEDTSAGADAPKQVRASFNYTHNLDAENKLTELYFYEDVKASQVHAPGDAAHECTVTSGWAKAGEFDLDVNGFAVKSFESEYSDWEDDGRVRETFYPEVVEFLKRETGAKRVLVFDHTIRSQRNQAKKLTQETNTSQRAPVALVHCDYTAESGPVRVKQLLPDEADTLLSNRVAFYNVWKPLHLVEEQPLAMCDVTSSAPEDFFKLYLRYRERTGENYVMSHSDAHKWWYFPDMTPDKAIVLKTYESETDRARFVGHSAFKDPTSREDAPFRESCEIRTIAFF